MVERRALIEGLETIEGIDPQLAEEFIHGGKPSKASRTSTRPPKASRPSSVEASVEEEPSVAPPAPRLIAAPEVATPSPLTGVGRVPVGARVRTELAAALKRASLERQLQGIQPNSVQEILEDALELWLLKHGHLK
jgi:hypothetical protein